MPVQETRFPDAMTVQIQYGDICLLSVLGIISCGDTAPVDQVPSVEGSVDLVGGEVMDFHYVQRHRCVLSRDGRVRCWGDNVRGQLGDGTRERREEPGLVVGLEGVAQLAAGEEHNCALLEAGEVFCWGRNDEGQLGDGTTVDRLEPVRVVR